PSTCHANPPILLPERTALSRCKSHEIPPYAGGLHHVRHRQSASLLSAKLVASTLDVHSPGDFSTVMGGMVREGSSRRILPRTGRSPIPWPSAPSCVRSTVGTRKRFVGMKLLNWS